MDEESKQDLFEIKLNATGILYIKKLVKIVSACFVVSIIWGVIIIFWNTRDIIQRWDYEVLDRKQNFQYKVLPWLWIVLNISNAIGTYYYYKFFRQLNLSINTRNTSLFNQSFKYAITNGLIYLCGTIIIIVVEALMLIALFL